MALSRHCLFPTSLAVVLAGIVLWQLYRHVDQGVTLAYARSQLAEQDIVVEQLRAIVIDNLNGTSRSDVQQFLARKGVDWFEKDGDVVGGSLVFEFNAGRLVDVRSIYAERE